MTTLTDAQRREIEAREAAHRAKVAQNMRDAQPVHEELHAIGFPVNTVCDLYNMGYDYRSAIPVLLKHLPLIDNPNVKEAIVRCLTVKWARPVAMWPLIEEWRKIPGAPVDIDVFGLKWAIANALVDVADDTGLEVIQEMALNRSHGPSRWRLAQVLANSKRPEAVPTLIALLDDPDLKFHVIKPLVRRLKEEARPHLVRLLDDESPDVRKEAAAALKKLDKKKAAAEVKAAGG